MSKSRVFSLAAILSITQPYLLCQVSDLYEILDFMSGDSLFMPQLPRVAAEAAPHILAQHPDLAEIEVPSDLGGFGACDAFLETLYPVYGRERRLVPMPFGAHEQVGVIEEFQQMRPDMVVLPPAVLFRNG